MIEEEGALKNQLSTVTEDEEDHEGNVADKEETEMMMTVGLSLIHI